MDTQNNFDMISNYYNASVIGLGKVTMAGVDINLCQRGNHGNEEEPKMHIIEEKVGDQQSDEEEAEVRPSLMIKKGNRRTETIAML